MSREKKTILLLQWMQWSLLLIVLLLFMAACGGGGGGGTSPSCNSGYCTNSAGTCCPIGTDDYCPANNLCYSITEVFNGATCPGGFAAIGPCF